MKQQLSWTNFKSICITDQDMQIRYIDKGSWYHVFSDLSDTTYWLEITQSDPRNADQIDFEDNYKDDANQKAPVPDSATLSDQGKGFRKYTFVSGVGTSYTTITTRTAAAAKRMYITDISCSADGDGTFKFINDGNDEDLKFYKAKDPLEVHLHIPIRVAKGKEFKIRFKSDSGTSKASAVISGYAIKGA